MGPSRMTREGKGTCTEGREEGIVRECGLTASNSYREKSSGPFRMIRRLRLARLSRQTLKFRDGSAGISSMCAVETPRAKSCWIGGWPRRGKSRRREIQAASTRCIIRLAESETAADIVEIIDETFH